MSGGPEELSAGKRLLARVIVIALKLLSLTWRIQRVSSELAPVAGGSAPTVFAFWHGEQLIMIPAHAHRGVVGLASLSSDGALLARVISRFGYDVVRGSSSKGGSGAVKGCVQALGQGKSVGVAVDGPRGPAHRPQVGAPVMAGRTRRPIVFVVSRSWPVFRLSTWDGFQIPWPFARVRIAYGQMEPPADQPEAIESARMRLGERMEELGLTLQARGP